MGGSINTNVYLWSVGALALTLTVAALLMSGRNACFPETSAWSSGRS